MLIYPLKVTVDDPGWLVQSRDIPQLTTGAPRGSTREYAVKMGYEAFKVIAELLMEQGKPIPMPSNPQADEMAMTLSLNVEAKVLIWNAMVKKGIKPAEVARRLRPLQYPMTKFRNLDDPISLDVLARLSAMLELWFRVEVDGAHAYVAI
jgi:predicted RNase H-like HicB family nuclease